MLSEGTDLKNRSPGPQSLDLSLPGIFAQGLVLKFTDTTEAKGSQHQGMKMAKGMDLDNYSNSSPIPMIRRVAETEKITTLRLQGINCFFLHMKATNTQLQ